MVKTIIKSNTQHYQCEECGFQYADKEWALKCETWCKEQKSGNIEITSHGAPREEINDKESGNEIASTINRVSAIKRIFRSPFYWLVAIDGALALGLLYWWLLSKTTTWVVFYSMYKDVPLYFWPYVLLTLAAMILFGMVLAVAVYSWRHSKIKNIKEQGGTALGAAFGAFGAACPICGAFLLSLLGIAGGLAVFPLQGLELKLLSAVFFGVSLALSTRKLQKAAACEDCEIKPIDVADDEREEKKAATPYSYQTPLAILFLILLFAMPLWKQEQIAASANAKNGALLRNNINSAQNTETDNPLYNEVVAKVLPREGFETNIVLGDAIVKLVENGVIDLEKFKQIYRERGMSEQELAILTQPSYTPLKMNANNAGFLVNILWPLGLANKTGFNEKSPVKGESLFNFASTGGWTLGKENNGGTYFNKFEIVTLTPEQETVALEVAQNTYRPCCNNSTFFQDCNHGSALLGLIELGASQGLSKEELYKVALRFNSFWFPQNYIETALYYKLARNTDWEDVDPKEIMSLNYSSISGWVKNVGQPFQEIVRKNPGLLPQQKGGAGCGV